MKLYRESDETTKEFTQIINNNNIALPGLSLFAFEKGEFCLCACSLTRQEMTGVSKQENNRIKVI